jgi:hypothetical protein
MTRIPPAKPRQSRDNDRFVPAEEMNVPDAEVLEEYPSDGQAPAEPHFPVLREIEGEPPATTLSTEPVLERGYSPSAAILRSRKPRNGLTEGPRWDRASAPQVFAQVGPPVPLLLIAVVVVLALAL